MMMQKFQIYFPRHSLLCVFLAFVSIDAPATAADTESELRNSVAHLNSWLGANANARRWRQVLNLNVLDAQAALGYHADPKALIALHSRFNSGIPGLEHPFFRRTRDAISDHLDQLSQRNLDIGNAIAESQSQFRQISLAELESLRATAVDDVKMLKRFYTVRRSSEPRALLFNELKPDEVVSFLESITFEVPPERSRTVIENEIEANEEQKKFIAEQIDKLNEQSEQVRKWLDELGNDPRGDDVPAPTPDDNHVPSPMPADDQSPGEVKPVDPEPANTQSQESQTEAAIAKSPQDQQDQLQQLETRQRTMQSSIQEIESRIVELRQEIVDLDQSESERVARFQSTMAKLNSFLAPFEALRTEQNDVYFGSAYQSLNQLKTAYLNGANPNTRNQFAIQLKKLQQAQALLASSNDRRAAADVGLLAGWLEGAGQAQNLIAAIRTRHSLANLYVTVSNRLVNQLAARPVNQTRPVNEYILGRLMCGVANANGTVAVAFTPDPHQVRAAIDFRGGIDSDTYTRAGRLTAYTGAHADFNVRRNIFANVGGMFANDIYGDLQLNSRFKCIDSKLCLVQRIARKKYYKSKYQAEAISRERTIAKVFPEFRQQTNEALARGYEQLEKLNRRQTDNQQVLPAIYLHTTHDRLIAVGHRGTRNDLGATVAPVNRDLADVDVNARIHESLLSNYISPLVSGKKMTNQQIADQFREILGKSIAVDDESGQPQEEFSITFDDARPVQFEFDGNTAAVTISGKEFSRAGERIRNGLRIRLAFKIVTDGDQLQVVPESEVDIQLINPRQTNIQTVSFISFLKSRLSDVLGNAFKDEVVLPNNLIPLENLGPEIKPIASQLQLVQLRMEDGWLYSGWKYQSPNSYQYATIDTPAIWPKPIGDIPQLDLDEQIEKEAGLEPEKTETGSE